MNKSPTLRPFIPSWLDDLGLSQAEFRLYCHLCRCADKTRIAFPSYRNMTEVCGTGKTTSRRCLESLAERGMIAKVGKPFGGSCRYRVLDSIVPPGGQMDVANSSTTGTIEAAPIVPPQDCNSPSSGTPIVPPQGQEGYPLKGIQGRVSNKEKNPPAPKGEPEGEFEMNDLNLEIEKTKIPDSLAETIWKLTPKMGRERSSEKQLEDALKKIPRSKKPTPEKLLAALEAWNKSETWTKDGGQFVGGIHIWVKNQKWKNPPEPSAPRSAQTQTQTAPPPANARTKQSHEVEV